ncbi:glycerate dehydrogenase [Alcanivorax sp. S71-1-4]|uniref:D-2-hydroxyacid dehydrogenase n=1 Tax=Alcanivorax sp. S71-1-4 TaxID=1177159 RepID=UPI001358BC25|nr:D-2-hydroxyacid dehydrogenase [Alcanivorax sp. S71-1-4]KAF0810146.1 glycerate dehydrogenase [Alcanivorax sp. S71-1-4]
MKGVFLDTGTLRPAEMNFTGLEQSLPEWQRYDQTRPDEVADRIAGATVVVSNKVVLDAALIRAAADLKLICVCATGTNNVDLAAARERGIPVCNVGDYAGPSVAQHTLALMLGLATRWHDYQQDVLAGEWSRSPMFCLMHRPVVELAGKKLGIIGYGTLGRDVARLGKEFGMQLLVAEGRGGPQPGRVPLAQLLADADVVSLHCPLTDDTRGVIGADALRTMKRSALLINTARGGLVDEIALREALLSGEIAGAALDVLSAEPPPADHVLLRGDVPNLIITPHNAWVSVEARQRLLDGVVNNIRAWRAGAPTNQVN